MAKGKETMSTRTCKVGVHGRNHAEWHDLDFQVLRDAGLEVVKAMSQTRPHHFERMKRENPNVEIITRLYGSGQSRRCGAPGRRAGCGHRGFSTAERRRLSRLSAPAARPAQTLLALDQGDVP